MNKVFFLALFLVGCLSQGRVAEERQWRLPTGRIKVVSTINMIHDVVKEVGGDEVDALVLIRGELDPHTYEMVKGDDEKFARADLIFYNGLGLEHTLSLRRNLEGNPKAIAVAEPLLERDPSSILIVDGQYDPHVWTDISLWMQSVDPVVETLSSFRPEKASYFEERGEQLKEEMRRLDQMGFEKLQKVALEKRYLVTSHDAFNYFARRYLDAKGDWQTRFRAPEGLAPEAQLSISDILSVINYVQENGVSVLFPEANVSKDSLRKILSAGKEKGCLLRLCETPLFGDSMQEGQSYLEMMEHNISTIAKELDASGTETR